MFLYDFSFCYQAPFDSAYEKDTISKFSHFKYKNYHGLVTETRRSSTASRVREAGDNCHLNLTKSGSYNITFSHVRYIAMYVKQCMYILKS